MENALKNALTFYVLATQLKYKIRSGWDDRHWNITAERRESIAEHIYGTCILAIAIASEFDVKVDLQKVIMMLVLHELGEVVIGDITPFDNISREEKIEMEYKAIWYILGDLRKKKECYDLLLEFEEKQTKEAIFASHCDKLDADFQAKTYQDMGYQNPLSDQENNIVFKNPRIQQMLENGAKEPFDIWYEWDKPLYEDDKNFLNLLNYIKEINTQELVALASNNT